MRIGLFIPRLILYEFKIRFLSNTSFSFDFLVLTTGKWTDKSRKGNSLTEFKLEEFLSQINVYLVNINMAAAKSIYKPITSPLNKILVTHGPKLQLALNDGVFGCCLSIFRSNITLGMTTRQIIYPDIHFHQAVKQ